MKMTNKEFALKNQVFREACKLATMHRVSTKGEKAQKISPTTRQASKYRNKKGTAYRWRS